MHYRFFLLIIFFSSSAIAQPSDFIVIKKRGKTIRSLYSGMQTEFITNNGVYRNALINIVRNDSIYIQEFLIQRLPTTFGSYITDTVGSFRYNYHYNDIRSFGPPKRGFNMKNSGSSLMGGAILLVLGSAIVYFADREKFSPVLMGSAAGLGLLGYFIAKKSGQGIIIGKNGYSIQYMDMTP